jgi:hypothetical protein
VGARLSGQRRPTRISRRVDVPKDEPAIAAAERRRPIRHASHPSELAGV